MAVTLFDAAEFIQEQARELILMNLAYVATKENIKALQQQARQNWNQSQAGWRTYSLFGYAPRKRKLFPNTKPGYLTGAWEDYRTINRAEMTFFENKGKIDLMIKAVNPTAKQKNSVAAKLVGKKTLQKKPWVDYPQRRAKPMPDNYIQPKNAAILPACKGNNFKELVSQLPLFRVKSTSLKRKGKVLCRINGSKVTLQSAWRRALQ